MQTGWDPERKRYIFNIHNRGQFAVKATEAGFSYASARENDSPEFDFVVRWVNEKGDLVAVYPKNPAAELWLLTNIWEE